MPTRAKVLKPPQAPHRWQGVRGDTFAAFGNKDSRNARSGAAYEFPAARTAYLNIWSQAEHSAALPVMVWFHGGAHTGGFGRVDLSTARAWRSKAVGNDQHVWDHGAFSPPRPE